MWGMTKCEGQQMWGITNVGDDNNKHKSVDELVIN
jgi:hypothetical protein